MIHIKTLIFGDIHSNLPALEAVLEQEEQWDEVLFLGDAVICGPFPNEVVSLVANLRKNYKGAFISGNHDREAANFDLSVEIEDAKPHKKWVQWTKRQLTDENLEFLRSLDETCVYESQGIRMRLIHGNVPTSPGGRVWPDTPAEEFEALGRLYSEPCILLGHSHIQFINEVNGITFVNPGGLGQPRLGPVACYVLLQDGKFEMKYAPYDTERTCKAMDDMPLLAEFVDAWKEGYKTGTLPWVYNIRDYSYLKEAGYR